ncbi:MAG: LptA/OstA family protein [Rhodospirillaceae bacterium]
MRGILATALFSVIACSPSLAQSLLFVAKNSDKPIEVNAKSNIEWQQEKKRFIARGDAVAVQGDVSVAGDELMADYRTLPDGSNELYRVFASGNVTMRSATETATGDAAVYDFDKAVLVLEGDGVRLVTEEGAVQAARALQYWSNERVAVAEGSAMAEDAEAHRLFADKLIAFFRQKTSEGEQGATPSAGRGRADIVYLQAFGNVRMETRQEIVSGERGSYNIETGVATLDGSVKISQGQNLADGEFAVVNVKGGTSRLFPSAAAAGMQSPREDARVRALIAPSTRPASGENESEDAGSGQGL